MDYLKGEFYKRTITFDPEKKQILFSKPEGSYVSEFKTLKCIFHGFTDKMTEVEVNNESSTINTESIRLLDGLKYLEEIYDPTYFNSLRKAEKLSPQNIIVFSNSDKEIRINWK